MYWSLKNFEYPTTKAEVKFEKSTIKYKPYSKFKEFQKIELEKVDAELIEAIKEENND